MAPSYSTALAKVARDVLNLMSASGVWIALARPSGELAPAVAVGRSATGPITLNPVDAPPHALKALRHMTQDKYLFESANIRNDPFFAGMPPGLYGSLLCAHIHDNKRLVGALVVARAVVGEFTTQQRALVSLYANHIATTIQLIDTAAQKEAQARELSAMLDATRALTGSRDSRGVISAIASSIRQVITCDAALIYRYEERAELLLVAAGLGAESEQLIGSTIPVQDQRSLAAQVATTRETRSNVLLRPDDHVGALTGALATRGPVMLICAPLMAQERLLGVVMLARVRPFADDEILAVGRLSSIAAAALERVMLTDEARAQRDQISAVFASASDGFALIGGDLRLIEVNTSFGKYLGHDAGALQGLKCWQALSGARGVTPSPDTCLFCHGSCRVRACVESGLPSVTPIECEFPEPRTPARPEPAGTDGPQSPARVVSFTLTPILGPAGLQALLVGRDITQERAIENSRGEFLEQAVHEIRQPLHNLTMNVETLLDRWSEKLSPEARRRHEAGALAAALSVRTLLDDLFVLTRRRYRHFSVSPSPNDLSAVARKIHGEFSALAAAQHVRLQVDAPQGLPLAMIDMTRADQVARNFVGNALKFTPPDGLVTIATRVEDLERQRWAVLEVTDTGAGIPPESMNEIFRSGYQATMPGREGRTPGSGYGLAIVRYIMTEHQGRIKWASVLGKGSRFTVYFPLARGSGGPISPR